MMFVKQIDKAEALRLAARGIEIQVLSPNTAKPNGWTDYDTEMLNDMLDGCLFFRREPALEDAGFKQAIMEMEGDKGMAAGVQQDPEACGDKGSAHEAPSDAGSRAKRKKIDLGKMKALRDAGWSLRKIADEMGLSDSSVCRYLNKIDEEEAAKGIAESR